MPVGASRPGSMGVPPPGVRVEVRDGRLLVDPATVPSFFLRYLESSPAEGLWDTGDLVERDEDGFLWFRGRADDVIVSAGYRIGPVEVEAAPYKYPRIVEFADALPRTPSGKVWRSALRG
jgi:acyl-coenzyme A synthetase/AMP-(fatty) acid ligase